MQNTILSSNVRFVLFAIIFAPNKSEEEQNKVWTELEQVIDTVIEADNAMVASVRQAQIQAAGTTLSIPTPSEGETQLAQQLKLQIKARQVNPHTLRAFIGARADRYGNFGHNLVAVTVPAYEATTLHPTYWTDLLQKVNPFHTSLMGVFNTMTSYQMAMGENTIEIPAISATLTTQKETLDQVLQARDYASLRPMFGCYMIALATYMATVAREIDNYATTGFQAIDTDGKPVEITPTN